MIREIPIQGEVSVTGTTLYTCPATKVARFVGITATNPLAFLLTLERYDKSLNNTVTVYTFSLDAGDFFSDNNPYILEAGDKLILTSSIANTSYTAHFVVTDATN